MKVLNIDGTQSLKVIPRSEFSDFTLVITNEFSQVSETILGAGTYDNGFFTFNFTFVPQEGLHYKLVLSSNNQVQWKGKAIV